MSASAVSHRVVAASARSPAAVAALLVDERDRDTLGVALPRPEVHLVVRFGAPAQNGLDLHAMGGRDRVIRKRLRSGQRFVTARLQLGAAEAVLGVPASALAGRVVAIEDLWSRATTRRLYNRLAGARDGFEAAALLDGAIAERVALTKAPRAQTALVLEAADRLTSGNVTAVALDLGLSERHLRRIFREVAGVSPKTFAKLTRFRHAVRAARAAHHEPWAAIAATAGYYDQAHLIAEFRAIAGVTPRALLSELDAAHPIG